MKNRSGCVLFHHRQISCSCSGLNQAAKATPGRQSEGSVCKDPKRLTQLGLKLLWVYQWFIQCKSKWQKARFCHFHLWAGMLASSNKYWKTHSRVDPWQYALCFPVSLLWRILKVDQEVRKRKQIESGIRATKSLWLWKQLLLSGRVLFIKPSSGCEHARINAL